MSVYKCGKKGLKAETETEHLLIFAKSSVRNQNEETINNIKVNQKCYLQHINMPVQ